MNKINDKSVIYIAGPMTGYVDFNFPAFNRAETLLREKYNCTIINPASNFNGDITLPWETYMRLAIQQVCQATHLCMLDGWENSRGARIEHSIATTIGNEILTLSALIQEEEAV